MKASPSVARAVHPAWPHLALAPFEPGSHLAAVNNPPTACPTLMFIAPSLDLKNPANALSVGRLLGGPLEDVPLVFLSDVELFDFDFGVLLQVRPDHVLDSL